MTIDPATLAAIAGMAIVTYVNRLSGLVLVRFVRLDGRTKAALDALPGAILMAVIAPMVLTRGPAESLAAAITVIAALRLPLLAAVGIGVASVVALRHAIG
jgi:uncharacterized membrane protein